MLKTIAGEPCVVPADLLRWYPELGDIRLRQGGLLPRVGGWCLGRATVDGITLRRTVWLGTNTVPSAELLLHELRHVHQFESVPAFPIRYAWESLRRGYHHNRFEVEARQFASARTRPPIEVTSSEDA